MPLGMIYTLIARSLGAFGVEVCIVTGGWLSDSLFKVFSRALRAHP